MKKIIETYTGISSEVPFSLKIETLSEILEDLKLSGATDVEILYKLSDSFEDTFEFKGFSHRLETDKEYEQRLERNLITEKWKKDIQYREYLKLKQIYE